MVHPPFLPLAKAAHPSLSASRSTWLSVSAVLALCFTWLAVTAWLRPLTLPDEGRYAGVALEMLRSHQWAVPTLDGLPFFHKPPLFYWITACAMSVFGVTEWSARLASLLGATLGAGALYLLVRHQAGERMARTGLLVLLTQPLWFIGAQFANMDMLVAGCISATLALLAHAALQMQGGRPWRRALLAAYACAALGVLAKGLIGAVLPALVMLVWLASLKRWRTLLALLWPPGIALFTAIALPWFVRMQWEFPGFFDFFIVQQHFHRFAQGGFNNAEPMWFYLLALPVLSLPWMLWLLPARQASYWQRVRRQPMLLLMWIWMTVVVVFFSLPQSKLLGYVLPAVPALAYLIGDAAAMARRKRLLATAALSSALCLGVVIALTIYPLPTHRTLAHALAQRQLPNEPIVFIDDYYYDLPFYANTGTLPWVVNDWASPDVLKHDNWRRELGEGMAFAPDEAASRLIDDAALSKRLCSTSRAWVVATDVAAPQYAFLNGAERIARENGSSLWRVERAARGMARGLGCL